MSAERQRRVAVIAGATGVVGYDLACLLANAPDWDVVALARRPLPLKGMDWISVDLTDSQAAHRQLACLRQATHLFYCARYPHRIGTPEPIAENMAMLDNFVDPIVKAGARLAHVHVVHGTKWYGSTLGPFPTPAREDDPRLDVPNFYYHQQDYIEARGRDEGWAWSTSRPHGLLHAVPDTPRNLVLVIAVYAALCRELGWPLYFPGTEDNFKALYQCTSTDRLARAMRFIAETPGCANQAFNVTNGEFFRWSRVWPQIAHLFGMDEGPVRTVRLAETMPHYADLWQRIVQRHGLVGPAFDRLVLWDYGDFIFTPGWDMMSDNGRILRAGFEPPVPIVDEFKRYFALFRARRIIP